MKRFSTRRDPERCASETIAQHFRIQSSGTLALIWALTPEALEWLEASAPEDAQWWGAPSLKALVCEPRFLADFLYAVQVGFLLTESEA